MSGLDSFHCKGLLKLETKLATYCSAFYGCFHKKPSLFPRHVSLAFFIPLVKLFPLMYFIRPGLSFLFQNTVRPDLPFLFHNIINTGVHMLLGISLMHYRCDVIKDPNIFFDTVTNTNSTSWRVIIIMKLYNMILMVIHEVLDKICQVDDHIIKTNEINK